MPGNKKPRKKHTPRSRDDMLLRHQPWKVAQVFGTLDGIMHALETDGEFRLDEDDTPMYRDPFDQCWYPIGPSLRGMCDAFDIHAARKGIPEVTEGVRNLYTLIEEGQELCQTDLDMAYRAIAAMKREAMSMTSAYATQIVIDSQIKFELDDRAAAQEKSNA
jgi:hypothetical protein